MHALARRSYPVWVLLVAGACGGTGGPAAGSAAAPPSGGQVWEVRDAEDRSGTAGAIVAFVNGVHVMVIDGDRLFGGMTELAMTKGRDGSRTMTFAGGLSADMAGSGDDIELRFSSGERVMLRRRPEGDR